MDPLVVSEINPRYFTTASAPERAVYLVGAHIHNNLQDGMGPGEQAPTEPERFDYEAYLAFLAERGLNFVRLWRWEHFQSQAGHGASHLNMTPQPWPRTGPGTAKDGKPKFDLTAFDPAYFDRLRARVQAAGEAGIYVGVMLFEGFGLHLTPPPDDVEGHPFHAGNNVNGIAVESIVDYQVRPLDPVVQQLQEAYLRKVVDTLHDLPNVLYEVANESSGLDAENVELPDGTVYDTRIGDSTEWQYWVIDFVKRYEREQGYDQHPIGMTMQFPVREQSKVNAPLFDGPADWVSPGFEDAWMAPGSDGPAGGQWYNDPPPADGRKVVISDTDHYAPGNGDPLWAWKTFLRGHHPVLMDFGLFGGVNPGGGAFEHFEPGRYAMGDTLRYAGQVDLLRMTPRGEFTSTGFALANPGVEYLVLQPAAGEPFTLHVDPGRYAVEWFNLDTRRAADDGEVIVAGDEPTQFRAPFGTPAPVVLYLHRG